jgi:hypothetical protein
LRFAGSVASLWEKGTLGTEFTVPPLPDGFAADLRADGLEVSHSATDGTQVLIPAHIDPSVYQKKLYEAGIFCKSIQKRTMPLETLLYGNAAWDGKNGAVDNGPEAPDAGRGAKEVAQ